MKAVLTPMKHVDKARSGDTQKQKNIAKRMARRMKRREHDRILRDQFGSNEEA